jgi:predicted nucleic acid-binding protein
LKGQASAVYELSVSRYTLSLREQGMTWDKLVNPGFLRDTNDLWIASAAYAMNSTLVTTDKDFDHPQPKYISIDWIDPEQLRES